MNKSLAHVGDYQVFCLELSMTNYEQKPRLNRGFFNFFRALTSWMHPRRRYQPSRHYMRGSGAASERNETQIKEGQIPS